MKSRRVAATTKGASRAKWLIVASGKGGSGKTTTSRNLAVHAAESGLSVLLIDLDRQQTLTQWFRRRPTEAKSISLLTISMMEVGGNLKAVEDGVADQGIDLVIVDTPPGVEDQANAMRLLLRKATFVLAPSGQGTPDLSSVIDWMRFLKAEKVPAAFVLNRVKRSAKSYHAAKLALNRAGTLCPIEIRDLEDIQMTYDHGLGVAEVRGAAGAEDTKGVWDFVAQQLGI